MKRQTLPAVLPKLIQQGLAVYAQPPVIVGIDHWPRPEDRLRVLHVTEDGRATVADTEGLYVISDMLLDVDLRDRLTRAAVVWWLLEEGQHALTSYQYALVNQAGRLLSRPRAYWEEPKGEGILDEIVALVHTLYPGYFPPE